MNTQNASLALLYSSLALFCGYLQNLFRVDHSFSPYILHANAGTRRPLFNISLALSLTLSYFFPGLIRLYRTGAFAVPVSLHPTLAYLLTALGLIYKHEKNINMEMEYKLRSYSYYATIKSDKKEQKDAPRMGT